MNVVPAEIEEQVIEESQRNESTICVSFGFFPKIIGFFHSDVRSFDSIVLLSSSLR